MNNIKSNITLTLTSNGKEILGNHFARLTKKQFQAFIRFPRVHISEDEFNKIMKPNSFKNLAANWFGSANGFEIQEETLEHRYVHHRNFIMK